MSSLDIQYNKMTRRNFLQTASTAGAGLLAAPFLNLLHPDGQALASQNKFLTQVALAKADNYNRVFIKERVQHLFESIGGISDVVKPGDKVALKLNLTGGSYWASHQKLNGLGAVETMWTHPEVLRAVAELLLDSIVDPDDIFIVEALWDPQSFNDFGYREVQDDLGLKLVDLNKADPYPDFILKEVGDNAYFYHSFKLNRILDEIDVYVSLPKMKQHASAGVTHSIKNQIGIVPLADYMQNSYDNYRSHLHNDGGETGFHLPRSICDLYFINPVHLTVIDGIKTADAGEGPWISTFKTASYNVLLAGKNAVAADSVASWLMGNDPRKEKLSLPGGGECDNYLEMLHQKGMGTNQLREIQFVGDGTDLVTAVHPGQGQRISDSCILEQNYPNPFNPATSIGFYLPKQEHVTVTLFDINGRKVQTLVNSTLAEGQHVIHWKAGNLPAGVYIYQMQAGKFSNNKKMTLMK